MFYHTAQHDIIWLFDNRVRTNIDKHLRMNCNIMNGTEQSYVMAKKKVNHRGTRNKSEEKFSTSRCMSLDQIFIPSLVDQDMRTEKVYLVIEHIAIRQIPCTKNTPNLNFDYTTAHR